MSAQQGRWHGILAELERRRAFSSAMGGSEKLERHRSGGKLDARQRAAALFDDGSFVEIGRFAAALTQDGDTPAPADALVAGFGRINGRPALAAIEDFTVLGGSIGDASADKRYRLTELAAQERLPLIFMLEGAGHRPTNSHAGRSPNDLQGLADLSGKVPMVCLVLGASAGHGALTAPLSDFVVMTEAASMFAAGPLLVKGAIGEVVTKEQLGGPQIHVATSGVAHNLVTDDAAAIAMARRYLSYFPLNAWDAAPRTDGPDIGRRRLDALLDIIDPDPRIPFKMGRVLEMLVDEGSLFEVQPQYGASLITALGRLGGQSVAIVANDPSVGAGAIDANAADKATHFMDVAGAFHLPVIFLTDNPGVMAGTAAEKSGVLRHAARMFVAQHRLRVPKLHVSMRKAFGFGSSIMAMNPFDNQTISLAFPAITLGAMPVGSGAAAAKLDADARARMAAEQAGSAYHIAGKVGFDDVIDPRDLRNALLDGLALTEGRVGLPRDLNRVSGILP
ncbi:acyl-CoA carboxylase subunit beta [Sphingomonas sp. KC8]|uniref:acyl-CoA carboxylase subunit beta n=1 Tax=Sphingomonas sp. KC8 TaxID=1030157 RepID=UPI00031FF92B|nr:carboxyl transferase domain-containing protein [Sphingomonas sp. KC8]ARS26689.1 propionyl-CoA carboxylase [Sphingomonas sp. KC8]